MPLEHFCPVLDKNKTQMHNHAHAATQPFRATSQCRGCERYGKSDADSHHVYSRALESSLFIELFTTFSALTCVAELIAKNESDDGKIEGQHLA